MARKYKTAGAAEFADAINGILNDYRAQIRASIEEIVPDVAKDCRNKIKSAAPRRAKNSKGYNKSWKVKTKKEGAKTTAVVYSGQPGLPHLLENGHLTRSGTKTAEIKHIAPAADEAAKDLQQKITRMLNNT